LVLPPVTEERAARAAVTSILLVTAAPGARCKIVDREWVQALKRAEAGAFDAVYAAYHARLYNYLYRLAGRAAAEDLCQETWMKLARHATRLRDDTDLGAWLFTVARNAWLSHKRWLLVDAGRKHGVAVEPALAPPGPEHAADARRRLDALERALASLPLPYREVLLLVSVEGLDQAQAAGVLGLSYDALRQRLARARALLNDQLTATERKRGAGP
jgi:RNA polymerase sigma-70 factor (ECF subfamily)